MRNLINRLPVPQIVKHWLLIPLWCAIVRLSKPEVRIVTGGISFYALFSIFPLIYLTVTLLFTLLPADVSQQLSNTIDQVLVSAVAPLSKADLDTIRSMTMETRAQLHEELRRACQIVEGLGGRFTLEIFPGYPPTICAPEAVDVMMGATKEILGDGNVLEADPLMAAEDFSYMLQQAPGCMIQLGVHNPAWEDPVYPVHRADFQMDEDALPVGVAALVACAVKWMQEKR